MQNVSDTIKISWVQNHGIYMSVYVIQWICAVMGNNTQEGEHYIEPAEITWKFMNVLKVVPCLEHIIFKILVLSYTVR